MNIAGWYITHHNAALGTKKTTDLLRADWLTLFNWVSCIADRRRQLRCVGEGVYSDATQLNSTRRRVELRRYKRAFRGFTTRRYINPLRRSCYGIRIRTEAFEWYQFQ